MANEASQINNTSNSTQHQQYHPCKQHSQCQQPTSSACNQQPVPQQPTGSEPYTTRASSVSTGSACKQCQQLTGSACKQHSVPQQPTGSEPYTTHASSVSSLPVVSRVFIFSMCLLSSTTAPELADCACSGVT